MVKRSVMSSLNHCKNITVIDNIVDNFKYIGNDTDDELSSFSNDFEGLSSRGEVRENVSAVRLFSDAFGYGHKGVWALARFGDVDVIDGEVYIDWKEECDVNLSWNKICNLRGDAGIVCKDNGSGWGGWDDEEKCYLTDDTCIENNEFCMQIIEIEVTEKSSNVGRHRLEIGSVSSKDKPVLSSVKSFTDNGKCTYVFSKGKKSGLNCDNVCDIRSVRCPKHLANVESSKSLESSLKMKCYDSNDDEKEVSPPLKEISNGFGCEYIFKKGKSNGKCCGKSTFNDSNICSKHKKRSSDNDEKNENSEHKKSTNGLPQCNIINAINEYLVDILKDTLKPKHSVKAINAIMDEKAQKTFEDIIYKIPSKDNTNKSGRKYKKKKNPNAPKTFKTAYLLFSDEVRPGVVKANPDWNSNQVMIEIARMWKKEDRDSSYMKKFFVDADKDKIRYKTEMENYLPSVESLNKVTESDTETKAKKTRKSGPKRGKTSFFFFCDAKRSEVKDKNIGMKANIINTELGHLWRALTEDEKAPFKKMADKDKKRYIDEKDNWVDDHVSSSDKENEVVAPKSNKASKKKNVSPKSQ